MHACVWPAVFRGQNSLLQCQCTRCSMQNITFSMHQKFESPFFHNSDDMMYEGLKIAIIVSVQINYMSSSDNRIEFGSWVCSWGG